MNDLTIEQAAEIFICQNNVQAMTQNALYMACMDFLLSNNMYAAQTGMLVINVLWILLPGKN
jgi:hypothetical protein